ncbi:putative bifunctional diguanylate cyclase/phosphodiesterase [Corallincola spongiicola]|uniref:GGDEF domain-containing response regulator n=1 Tax=Corallincola spongiicola TaxID=2520508 RepID=A0ABY1WPK8_9GAMM|nr:EAL domain-containing protein [Corallincola spongiicola]TAA45929.1 GGDEF domain-containing response regulator [Corallincola spongiicola]
MHAVPAPLTEKPVVLVCDDDITIRLMMRETLEREVITVIEAADGKQALEMYKQHSPDLVLLDVSMPHFSGYEVCEVIRQSPLGADVPVVMVTSSDDLSSINRAYESGATDFLAKPITWQILGQRVRYMLRASRAFRDLKRNEERLKRNEEHLKQNEERLRVLAYFDNLTGLPNRQMFNEDLQRSIAQAKREGLKAALLFIDLDQFKRFNDTLGHAFGDKLLNRVAEQLKTRLRPGDLLTRGVDRLEDMSLARLGGDEFTICLTQVAQNEDVARVASRVIESISQPMVVDSYEVVVTPSIGIAIYPDDGDEIDSLLKNADTAMYNAKAKGRGRFQFYSGEMNARALQRLRMENELRKAIDNNELRVAYQPKVDVQQRKFIGVEALVRWDHPQHGIVSPAEFIPLAEESGLIVDIDNWVLHKACHQASEWLNMGITCPVAVNVSALNFKKTNLVERIKTALREADLPASLLELEMTESIVMSDIELNTERLTQLKEMGTSISIDDFGTGYSSLSYLRRLPIDQVKIDRSFVNEIDCNNEDMAIVKAIIAMSTTLKMEVIAEGVETTTQTEKLSKAGCHRLQGFLYAKPMPAKFATETLLAGFDALPAAKKLATVTSN